MSTQNQTNPPKEEEKQTEEVQQQNTENQQQEGEQVQKLQQKKPQKFLKPDFIYCPNNKSLDSLISTYPHLQSLKDASKVNYEEVAEAKSYVIRSNNDDDIHKAIKYGVWCSTPPNNEMLDKAFKEAEQTGQEIYLFYSVVKSGQFVGVAKLKSALKEETFSYWWQHTKWRGHFLIEWLFVKDIIYKQFENLKNVNDLPVIRSKDGTEINWKETGLPMIQIYQKAPSEPNIFQDFEHMDQREQFQRYVRSQNTQQNQQGQNQGQNNGQVPQQQNAYQQQLYQQQQVYYQQFYSMPQYMNYYQQQMKYNNAFPPSSQQNYKNHGYNNNYYQNKGGYKKHNNYNGQKKYYNNYNNNNTNGNYNKYNNQNRHKNQQQQQQQQQQPEQQQ